MSTAEQSESVFGSVEPRCAKAIFDRLRAFALAALTRSRGRVSFVEVGANDGKRADPLYPHIMQGGWTGLLIEPLPDAFEALQLTYAGIEGLIFEQAAISDPPGVAKFFGVRGERNVLSSLSLAAIMKHAPTRPDLPGQIYEMEVRACGLEDLLQRHAISHLDVVAVDTEGSDDAVLSTINLENRAPALVLFEHVLLSREGSNALKTRLEALPYTLIWDRHDCMAIRHGTFDPEVIGLMKDVQEAARTG